MRLKAPATTANMGSGFDVVGMALKLHNTVQFEKADRFKVHSIGRYGLEIGDAVETFGNAIRDLRSSRKKSSGPSDYSGVRDTAGPWLAPAPLRSPPRCSFRT